MALGAVSGGIIVVRRFCVGRKLKELNLPSDGGVGT